MNSVFRFGDDIAELVNRFADDVHHASQSRNADRNGDRTALINRFHTANHTVGRKHRNGADATFAEMLLNFGNNVDFRFDIETVARNS